MMDDRAIAGLSLAFPGRGEARMCGVVVMLRRKSSRIRALSWVAAQGRPMSPAGPCCFVHHRDVERVSRWS
ncbi:hypothetical protein ACZ90_70990 [Streptomyces albus subsp. albus]|nr:hypothetical protein ACZ90_70990 [Streptomyces albus subsp. albus]